MMKFFSCFLIAFFCIQISVFSQDIVSQQYLKVKEGESKNFAEYLEEVWEKQHKVALKRGFITGYEVQKVLDSDRYDYILVIRYKDKRAYNYRERNFNEIINDPKVFPKGILMDGKTDDDMVTYLFKLVSESEIRKK
ncbi:hypothetical protein OO013_02225 [Mangrovivirga sp. M17]|uniref:Uncharacterized protein n=1 Tax=Mangrovivirga halotolerans TaxID=2993936 RepID=A0ABT3RLJ7_9BACT|nr:hypothetical protein [Mangrovivirga halotolerans]MCX2742661.1 hypothetical protein [Mangrovivirga halotolerans]